MSREKFSKIGQKDFGDLVVKLMPEKAKLQERVNNGLTMALFATELGLSPTTVRDLYDTLGITPRPPKVKPEKTKGVAEAHRAQIDALLKVVYRMATQLDVDTREIAPFMTDSTTRRPARE